MKHFSEISLIATVSFIGELLHYLIPLPVPSSIYGLLLMLLLLVTHIIKLDHVKATADWLISLMPVMFVGPTQGLIRLQTKEEKEERAEALEACEKEEQTDVK